TVSPSVSAVGQSFTNVYDLPTDPLMPDLEDTANLLNTGIFSGANDDEDVGAEADLNNLETTMNVSPIPTTKIHKDHPKDQIIGDINSATQIRRITKISKELAMVYKNKKDESGIVVRNKARLVAQGYTQEEGINYDEVFALVARIEAIRLFLAYASFMRFIVYQMDVKSAFLYGTIEEEVYVCQPHSFEDLQFPDKVYKVEKALYGLHQALKAWYETLSTYLLETGFRRGTIDKTLFIKKDKGDIMLVQRDDGIFVSQDKYVADILKKFDFSLVKTASTLIETNKALLKDEEVEDMDVHLYRSMIGSLMYLTAFRPDIMFAVCACTRFQVIPKVSHLYAVKRIFRYLKGQPKLGLLYPRDSLFDLEAFSDSDYVGDSLDRKSITGVDFLTSSSVHYALIQIHATVDGKTVVISESSVRSDLYFNYEDGITCLTNDAIFENIALMGVVRATIIAASLDVAQASGNISKNKSTTMSNDPLSQEISLGGNTPGSDEERIEQDDLMDFVPPTPHDSPLSGGYTPRSDEDLVIRKRKKKVRKLEKKLRARTLGMKLFKIGTSKRKSLDKENISKQGRKSDKIKPMFDDSDFAELYVDNAMENVEGDAKTQGRNTATIRRVRAFVPIETKIRREVPELAARSSKKDAEEELDQGSSKRQKTSKMMNYHKKNYNN
ncbi:putative ribonuclease H-like domain-containing protein, partial [Tanacetum coccineum]